MWVINFLVIALSFAFLTKNANAYLDPGTGSFIFQVAVGAFLGGIIAVKVKFKQLKDFGSSFFKGKKAKNTEITKKTTNDQQS